MNTSNTSKAVKVAQIKLAIANPTKYAFALIASLFISFSSFATEGNKIAEKAAEQGIETKTLEVANMLSITADNLDETEIYNLVETMADHYGVTFDTAIDADTYKAKSKDGKKLRLRVYNPTGANTSKVILTVVQ